MAKKSAGTLKGVLSGSNAGKTLLRSGSAVARKVRADDAEATPDLSAADLAEATAAIAIIEGAFLVAASDGEIADEEAEKLTELTVAMFDGEITREDVQAVAERVNEVLEAQGFEARIAAVAEALPSAEYRRLAFTAAAAMAYFDGVITEEEEAVFGAYSEALEISDEDAETLLEEVREQMGIEVE
jgi:uncharacterized tellurite resistance protein B-like protein